MNNDDTDDEDDHEYDDGDDDKDLQPRELILKVSLDVRYIFLLSKSSLGHVTKHDNITGYCISHCLSNFLVIACLAKFVKP